VYRLWCLCRRYPPEARQQPEDFTDAGIVRRHGLTGDNAANILDTEAQFRQRNAPQARAASPYPQHIKPTAAIERPTLWGLRRLASWQCRQPESWSRWGGYGVADVLSRRDQINSARQQQQAPHKRDNALRGRMCSTGRDVDIDATQRNLSMIDRAWLAIRAKRISKLGRQGPRKTKC
jgi:hypothetical protein